MKILFEIAMGLSIFGMTFFVFQAAPALKIDGIWWISPLAVFLAILLSIIIKISQVI